MAKLQVQNLEGGEKITENVYTPRGSMLFPKGQVVQAREIEILRAFFVKTVEVDQTVSGDHPTEVDENHEATEIYDEKKLINRRAFQENYEALFVGIQKYFYNASSGITPPLLDIRTQLEKLIDHINAYEIISFTPANMKKEDYLYHNSIMVALSSYQLAVWHQVDRKDWLQIAMGGLLHDIGMIRLDPDIVSKRRELTQDDIEHIRKHTVLGYNMLKNVTGINEGVKLCALQHHEKLDGSGYPLRVMGNKIHFYAKIVAIADIFHAMTNDRYYKKAISPYLVLEQLWQESFGKLDPALVQTFMNRVTAFQNGTLVILSDNAIGEIVFSDLNAPTRPWVKVNGQIINLTIRRDLHIKSLLKK